MTTNTWARLANSAVAELLSVPSTLVPGKDIPAEWTDNVTAVTGIAIGWIKSASGTFSAPPGPSLASAQAARIAALTSAANAAIVGGFPSSALGAPHTYPTDTMSQMNMTASVTASLVPGLASTWTTQFLCEDSTGLWAYLPHTAAQIQKAGQDVMAAILGARVQLATLTAQVNDATTVAAVQAIVWP